MTITERAEHEIKHMLIVSPETARELIAEISRLRAELEKALEDCRRFKAACCVVHGSVLCGEKDAREFDRLLMLTNSHYYRLNTSALKEQV